MNLREQTWYTEEEKRWKILTGMGYDFDAIEMGEFITLAMSHGGRGGVVVVVEREVGGEAARRIMIETCEAYAKMREIYSTKGEVN